MRVLCVGRHKYLSEHLCGYFRTLGAQCEPAVGTEDALAAAPRFEPHLIIAESELLGPPVLDAWSRHGAVRDVPLIAVSLTRRPEECAPTHMTGIAGVIYLPTLDRARARALLDAAHRPRGVVMPQGAAADVMRSHVAAY